MSPPEAREEMVTAEDTLFGSDNMRQRDITSVDHEDSAMSA